MGGRGAAPLGGADRLLGTVQPTFLNLYWPPAYAAASSLAAFAYFNDLFSLGPATFQLPRAARLNERFLL
jgi:hypothetical protein